jgi:hypothetical protein
MTPDHHAFNLDAPLVIWTLTVLGWTSFLVGAVHVAQMARIPPPPRGFWITLAIAAAIGIWLV